jgi:hypothetical protein
MVAVLAPLLAGCTIPVASDPNRYSIEPKTFAHLRAPQAVALLNAYKAESNAEMKLQRSGHTLVVERRQLMETALAMLGRALQQQGYTISPSAPKTITLRVTPTGAMAQAFRYTGRINLEARFGDGTTASIPQENLGATWERGFDGAVLFALNDLLEHERFTAYINK